MLGFWSSFNRCSSVFISGCLLAGLFARDLSRIFQPLYKPRPGLPHRIWTDEHSTRGRGSGAQLALSVAALTVYRNPTPGAVLDVRQPHNAVLNLVAMGGKAAGCGLLPWSRWLNEEALDAPMMMLSLVALLRHLLRRLFRCSAKR